MTALVPSRSPRCRIGDWGERSMWAWDGLIQNTVRLMPLWNPPNQSAGNVTGSCLELGETG